MEREKVVGWLVANCDCWKGEESTLNEMSDDQLLSIANGENAKVAGGMIANAIKAPRNTPITDLPRLVVNAFPPKKEAPVAEDESETEEEMAVPAKEEEAPAEPPPPKEEEEEEMMASNSRRTTNSSKGKTMTFNQWVASAPKEGREALEFARKVQNAERSKLVDQLTANVSDERKPAYRKFLLNKSIQELEALTELLPPQQVANSDPYGTIFGPGPDYSGAAGGPVFNMGEDNSPPLIPPTINYKEEQAKRLSSRTG